MPTPEPATRSALFAGLPQLPGDLPAYDDFRFVSDSDGAYAVLAPAEWADESNLAPGEVLVSSDNELAAANALISAAIVSGLQGVGIFRAEFFLDGLLEELEDPNNPCEEISREPYNDGTHDGFLYFASCSEGRMVQAQAILSDVNRESIIFVGVQAIQERDFEVFQVMLESLTIADPALLPPVQ